MDWRSRAFENYRNGQDSTYSNGLPISICEKSMLLIEMSGARAALALAQVDLHRGNGGGLMASTLQLKLFAILLWAMANLAIRAENIAMSPVCLQDCIFIGYLL
jgi:hypothetical protein